MTNAVRDNNGVTTLMVMSDANGVTPMLVYADPVTHAIIFDDNTTGSGPARTDALRDQNYETGLIATSNADGVTPVPIYGIAASGKIYINSV